MTRTLYRLPPNAATTITKPGRHADGGGLYLFVGEDGRRRSWTFMFTFNGRQREAGLGPAGEGGVSLKAARAKAAAMRELLAAGLDPIADRTKNKVATVPAFGEVAGDHIDTHADSWTNEKHRQQWKSSVVRYCEPITKMPVNAIDTGDILKVLTPLWTRTPETASRIRGRIEVILDAARALGHIDQNRANPARWKDHLDKLLPKRSKLSRAIIGRWATRKCPNLSDGCVVPIPSALSP